MCLAVPARIVELQPPDRAIVDLAGVRRSVNLMLTPDAQVGQYAIIHTGFAISLLDEAEAAATLASLAEMAQLTADELHELAPQSDGGAP